MYNFFELDPTDETLTEVAKSSTGDYGIIRRVYRIFERALKRFKDDVGLWVQYIEIAEGKLAGRIVARALQLHPCEVGLYVLGAQAEMKSGRIDGARILLQRGIRLNKESKELWREYVKFEAQFVEEMNRTGLVGGDELMRVILANQVQ